MSSILENYHLLCLEIMLLFHFPIFLFSRIPVLSPPYILTTLLCLWPHCGACRTSPTKDPPCPLQWKHGVLTTGLLGKFLVMLFLNLFFSFLCSVLWEFIGTTFQFTKVSLNCIWSRVDP